MLSAIRTYNHLTSSHRQIKAAVQRVLASPYRTQLVDRLLHQIETKYLKSTTDQEKSFWSDWYCRFTYVFAHAAPVCIHTINPERYETEQAGADIRRGR